MLSRPRTLVLVSLAAAVTAVVVTAAPAAASFHLMQIEQVVGAVCGNPTRQAIQLRTRAVGQNFIAGHRLVARDAAGGNPIMLINFPSNVANGGTGANILAVTSGLAAAFGVSADFTLTQAIPESYLAAGRLTFEDPAGNMYWSLAWGGAAYTGTNFGTFDNDADGNFGLPFGSALPQSTARGVLFQGSATDPSSANVDDYALTSGAATLTNNAGAPLTLSACVFGDGFAGGNLSAWSGATSFERCNGADDDEDAEVDEDYPVGQQLHARQRQHRRLRLRGRRAQRRLQLIAALDARHAVDGPGRRAGVR